MCNTASPPLHGMRGFYVSHTCLPPPHSAMASRDEAEKVIERSQQRRHALESEHVAERWAMQAELGALEAELVARRMVERTPEAMAEEPGTGLGGQRRDESDGQGGGALRRDTEVKLNAEIVDLRRQLDVSHARSKEQLEKQSREAAKQRELDFDDAFEQTVEVCALFTTRLTRPIVPLSRHQPSLGCDMPVCPLPFPLSSHPYPTHHRLRNCGPRSPVSAESSPISNLRETAASGVKGGPHHWA